MENDSYIYIRLGNLIDRNTVGAAIDLLDGITDPNGTNFHINNPLDSVNFIWQILDKSNGFNVEAELFRSFENPKNITVFFRNNFVVPNLRYRLLLFRVV